MRLRKFRTSQKTTDFIVQFFLLVAWFISKRVKSRAFHQLVESPPLTVSSSSCLARLPFSCLEVCLFRLVLDLRSIPTTLYMESEQFHTREMIISSDISGEKRRVSLGRVAWHNTRGQAHQDVDSSCIPRCWAQLEQLHRAGWPLPQAFVQQRRRLEPEDDRARGARLPQRVPVQHNRHLLQIAHRARHGSSRVPGRATSPARGRLCGCVP